MTESLERLRTKLEIVEAEAEFHSKAPPEPKRLRWWEVAVAVLMSAGIIYGIVTDEFKISIAPAFVLGVILLSRISLKSAYDVYPRACKIINYYKTLEEFSRDKQGDGG